VRPLARDARDADELRVNVTPLIDVVMVMIVFFLIVGKLAADERSPIELPDASATSGAADSDTLIINVAGDGSLILRGQVVTTERLGEALVRERSLHPGVVVRIRADRSLDYASVEPVVRACRAAGVTTVRLAATGGPAGAGEGSP